MTTQQMLSPMRKAITDYKMIQNGDKIAVGVSGGKDSMALLYLLKQYQRFNGVDFELMAITVDIGFAPDTFAPIAEFCAKNDIAYSIVKTDIKEIVFDVRKEENPCSLCAKMRRGALNNEINRLGFTKLALGHHMDDVVDTFMLSLFYEGRLNTFQPVSEMSRSGVTLIRPMVYVSEKDVAAFVRDENLPVVESQCPANKHTERESVKQILRDLDQKLPGVRQKFANAIMHPDRYNLWDKVEK